MKIDVASLKSKLNIRDAFERDGHNLTHCAGLWRTLCPFHREKTPSCYVYEPTHFVCYGCNARGDIFNYVMLRDGCSFREALGKLSGGRVQILKATQPRVRLSKSDNQHLPPEYFEGRMAQWGNATDSEELVFLAERLSVESSALCRLGIAWAEEHKAWAIPMRNSARRIVGIRLRDENGRKWAVKGSRSGLFIPSGDPSGDIVVTEGPTDCAAALSLNCFAIGKPSAMDGDAEIVDFLKTVPVRRVIIIPDSDPAGLSGASKLMDMCHYPTCEMILPTKDVRELVKCGGGLSLFWSLLRNQQWRMKH